MPQRAIVLFPTGAGSERIEGIRWRHDPQADLIAAHITLVFPFESAIDGDSMRSHVAAAVRGLPRFHATLSGVSTQDLDYIFLDVAAGIDSIMALHDCLYSGPLQEHRSGSHVYRPHMTLGRIADAAARSEAVAAIRAEQLALSALIDEVVVFSVSDRRVEFIHPLVA